MQSLVNAISAGMIEQIVAILFLLVSTFVLPKVYQWLNLKNDDRRRVIIENALQAALKYGAAKVTPDYSALTTRPDLLQQLLDNAEQYAIESVPDTMKKLGIPDEAVRAKLEARLIDFITELAEKNAITAEDDSLPGGMLATMSLQPKPPTGGSSVVPPPASDDDD